MSWVRFAAAAPERAAVGRRRLAAGAGYLGTVRQGALPQVHPVSPVVGERRLMLITYPSSPKAGDLRQDGRYALHATVPKSDGTDELLVQGRARIVDDPTVRRGAAEAGYEPLEEYVLFELGAAYALANDYVDGKPNYRRWVAVAG